MPSAPVSLLLIIINKLAPLLQQKKNKEQKKTDDWKCNRAGERCGPSPYSSTRSRRRRRRLRHPSSDATKKKHTHRAQGNEQTIISNLHTSCPLWSPRRRPCSGIDRRKNCSHEANGKSLPLLSPSFPSPPFTAAPGNLYLAVAMAGERKYRQAKMKQ